MVELSQVEQHTYATYCEHEDQEHCLFCGTRHVTLHLLHTRVAVALEHPWHVETVQKVLACQETDLQRVAEDHLDDVETGDAFLSSHFSALVCRRGPPRSVGDLLDLQVVILLTAVGMHQDAVDVASVKLASMVVVVATVVTVSVVIHVGMQEGIASIACFGRLVDRICDEAQTWCAH